MPVKRQNPSAPVVGLPMHLVMIHAHHDLGRSPCGRRQGVRLAGPTALSSREWVVTAVLEKPLMSCPSLGQITLLTQGRIHHTQPHSTAKQMEARLYPGPHSKLGPGESTLLSARAPSLDFRLLQRCHAAP